MNNKGQMLMKVMVVNVMVMYLAFHSMRRRLPKTPLVSTEATPNTSLFMWFGGRFKFNTYFEVEMLGEWK